MINKEITYCLSFYKQNRQQIIKIPHSYNFQLINNYQDVKCLKKYITNSYIQQYKTVQNMSQTLFKVMTYSYCRYQQQNSFVKDCLSALSSQILAIDSKLHQQIKQISQVLSLPSQKTEHQMSIIMEQQTQRSYIQSTGYEQLMGQLRQKFNGQIGRLGKMEGNIDKLVDIYKNQLLEMSKQMTKWENKNQDMKKQIKKLTQEKQSLETENNQLKDQITMQAAQLFISQSDQDVESVFDQEPKKEYYKQKNKEKQKGVDKKIGKVQPNQLHKQKKKQNQQLKYQNISKQLKNTILTKRKQQQQMNKTKLVQVRIHSEKDTQEQFQKWKKLSKKIDELKGKLTSYEDQIQQKDSIIRKLTNQLKQYKLQGEVDTQQRRKIKISNTTLRGQKTILQNQLTSMKKTLAQKTQLCNVQQIQIEQLKIQIQNSNQTIKWQNSTIDDLRSCLTKTQNKTTQQSKIKIEQLQKINQQLYKAINRHQNQLQQINATTLQIQQLFTTKINLLLGKITELQIILDQKNQHIIKLKTKGNNIGSIYNNSQNINPNAQYQNNQSQAYLNQLVKVLTKKIADRDQIIRKLQFGK